MTRSHLLLAAAVVFAAVYFVVDVRQRARVDRGIKRHRTDMTVYLAAAEALTMEEDPYDAPNPRGYRYVYPPLLAILFMPLAGWAPENAALVWFVISALAFGASIVLLLRLRVGDDPPLGWTAVIVAAFVCLGFTHQGFQRGQVTHLLLGLQVGALAALLGRRFLLAGLLLGFASALRLTPLLPAAAVGLGLLVHGIRGRSSSAWLRYGSGLALSLTVGIIVLPWLVLGSSEFRYVNVRWMQVTRDLQAAEVDLAEDYRINEWRFKNQAPRRVAGTWTGWARGVRFEKERPLWVDGRTPSGVDRVATAVAWLAVLLALVLGIRHMGDPRSRAFPVAYAAVLLLPVLVTRYAWPTHYLLALPAVALASAAAPLRFRGVGWGPAVAVLLAGALLFYAAHARALQWIGEAGCLLLACIAFLVLFLRRGLRETTP